MSTVTVDEEGCLIVFVSEEEKRRLCKPWYKSLIMKLEDKRISHNTLKKKLEQLWSNNGDITVIEMGNDFILVRFTSQDDYDMVLTRGPWLVDDHYPFIMLWRPDFDPYSSCVDKFLTWVKLPGLAIEYYDERFLQRVGDMIGKTLKVDMRFMGRYARLSVEVDMEKTYIGHYKLGGDMKRIKDFA